jgi:mRNA interferase HigB
MRVIAKKTLRAFWEQPEHRMAEAPMQEWLRITKHAAWNSPPEVKRTFNSADPIKGNRMVFDVGGNKWRIVARIDYAHEVVFIRFVGTHKEYDDIDVENV